MKKIKKIMMFLAVVSLSALCCGVISCRSDNGNSDAPPQGELSTGAYLSEENITLLIGETKQLSVGNGEVSSWTTSDSKIATVNNGLVTGKGEGVAFINAVVGENTLTCIVNVSSSDKPCDITLSYNTKTMNVGDNAVITGLVSRDGVAISEIIEWTSSNTDILSITPNGNSVTVSAKQAGEATLVAKVNSSTAVCKVTVKAAYDTQGAFSGCSEMATAKVTQNTFTMGAEILSTEIKETSSVTLYETAYCGEYNNNAGEPTNSLVLYATLNTTALEIIQTEDSYYRYGFIVQAVQITDKENLGYQEKSYVYYATQGNVNGEYGLFIENLPQGYYKAWAFAEYLDNDELCLERSQEMLRIGEINEEVPTCLSDFTMKIADSIRWGYGTPVQGTNVNESFKDANGEERRAVYAFDTANSVYDGSTTNNYYYSPKMQLDLGMTKTMLEEFAESGNSMLTFYLYYKTEGMGHDTASGKIRLLDLSKFDGATDNDIESQITSRIMVKSAPMNTWVRVQYDAALLAKYYDVVFGWNTAYPLFYYLTLQSGTLYVSDVTMEKPSAATSDATNVIADAYAIDASRTNYYDASATMRSNTRSGIAAQAWDATVSNRLDGTISKKAAFKIPLKELVPGSNGGCSPDTTVAFTLSPEVLTKKTLQNWMDNGYDYFTFSIYRQYTTNDTWENGLLLRTIDFDKMRANAASVSDTSVKANYVSVDVSGGTNKWHTISYSLADLLEFYDVLFAVNTPYFLCEAGMAMAGPDNALYISAVEVKKVDASNVVTDATLLTAKRTNNANGDAHQSKTVTVCDETITDRLGAQISKTAAFKVDLGDLTGKNALGDGCVELKLSSAALTKSTLKSLIAKGYTSLNFSIYRQWTTSETWECGFQITTLDFDKLRAGTPSVNDSSATVRSRYSTKVEISGGSNKWKDVSYSLTDLLEFYDVIFSPNSKYFMVEAGVGIVGTNEALYISAFEVKKVDVSNVVTDTTLLTAKRTNNANGDVHESKTVAACDEIITDRKGEQISKTAAFKVDLGDLTGKNALGDGCVELKLSSAALTKSTLTSLIAQGYTSLNFSIYRQWTTSETWECGLQITTLDFDKMRAGTPSVNDSSATVRSSYSTKVEISGGSNKWKDVSYSLADLLEFYDVIFSPNSKYFLVEAGVGIVGTNEALYISAFEVSK